MPGTVGDRRVRTKMAVNGEVGETVDHGASTRMAADRRAMPAERRTLTTGVLGFFSSVWVGIVWLVLLFVYCSIGSALPQVRQSPLLEMTEFQWFHWWPFNVLILLLCTSLTVVTIRRIPLRLLNSGVWMVHVGIIILCIGSYRYFGTKVEGDTPVFRRRIRIELPGLEGHRTLVALPGAHTRVAVGADEWHFSVPGTNTAWPILSDEHAGKTAYAVNVEVIPPSGKRFVRMLLSGYPQYTEDIIPGKGRAVRSTGKKLVDDSLVLSLEYEPQEYFHVIQTWALHIRKKGDASWSQRPVNNLPRYNDRIASRDQVFTDPGSPVSPRPLDLEVPPTDGGDALDGAAVRITGYLRYAHMEQRYTDGGERLNPVVRIRFLSDHAPGQPYELVAFDSARREVEGGVVRFVWLSSASEVASLPTDARPMLHIVVPEQEGSMEVVIDPEKVVGHDGDFTVIDGTPLAYRILNIHDDLALPGRNRTVSVAMVEIRTPEGRFIRMVADQPEMTRDMHGGSADPHHTDRLETGATSDRLETGATSGRLETGATSPREADPRIVMTYRPRSAMLILAAHPEGLHLVYNGLDGHSMRREVALGDLVELAPGLSIHIEGFLTHAVTESRPAIVPPTARRRDAGESFAMIRLEVNTGHGIQAQWLPFNQYVLPNAQYAYLGRFAYTPRAFRLADGSLVEVVFSRERRRLPAPLTLEDFQLDTHIGGYSGQVSTIRNYVSRLRIWDEGRWTEPVAISVNAPTEYGGYWYFQSMWDRPSPGDPDGGMNYTGLGVGNRNGVYLQLFGCCIAVSGMIFAFYVKPIVQRRMSERSLRKWEGEARAEPQGGATCSTGAKNGSRTSETEAVGV